MKKKYAKRTKSTPQYDSERETRVLLEQVRSEGKAVAEQYADIAKKLDKIDERLQKHDSVRFKLEWGIETLQNRIGTVDTKLDRVGNELETVKQAMLENSRDTKDLKKSYDEIKHLATNHEERLKKLETVS